MVGLRPHAKTWILTAAVSALVLVQMPSGSACDTSNYGCAVAGQAIVGGALFDITALHDHGATTDGSFEIDATGLVPDGGPQPQSALIKFTETSHVLPDGTGKVTVTFDGTNTVTESLGFTFQGGPDEVEAVPFSIIVDNGGTDKTYSGTLYIHSLE